MTAREILDRGAQRIEQELTAEPEVQGDLMDTMGRVYWQIGLLGKAERMFTRAVEVRSQALRRERCADAPFDECSRQHSRPGRAPCGRRAHPVGHRRAGATSVGRRPRGDAADDERPGVLARRHGPLHRGGAAAPGGAESAAAAPRLRARGDRLVDDRSRRGLDATGPV